MDTSITGRMKGWFKDRDKTRLEATARIGFTSILAIVLSVASLPKIIPPSERLLPGIVGVALALSIPYMMFTIGAGKCSPPPPHHQHQQQSKQRERYCERLR